MRYLPELDRWRAEPSDDLWMESYLWASWPHRREIHAQMRLHCLTTREAVKKVFKCDPEFALADIIPPRWSTDISHDASTRELIATIGVDIFDTLILASHADPSSFDDQISDKWK